MAKAGYKKRAYRASKSYRRNLVSIMAITLVAVAILGVVIFNNLRLMEKKAGNEAVISQLQTSIEDETQRTTQIEETGAYMESDEYVEKVAHEKIGLVYDNEVIYKAAE